MASKQSQRLTARAQLQQRMAEKAEQERKKRTVWWSIGGVGALVGLVVLAWGALALFGPEDDDSGSASPRTVPTQAPVEGEEPVVTDGLPAQEVVIESLVMSEPDASATADCEYTPTGEDAATPDASQPAAGVQEMTIETNLGTIAAEVDTANAPCTAGSFTHLAAEGYFDGSQCHRLVTDRIFVLQCGDPDARAAIEAGTPDQAGQGGPGYQYPEENLPADEENNYPAGTIAMANAGQGTTGSQFFIVYEDSTLSPAAYTVLGQVTEGMDLVEEVAEAGAV